MNVMRDASLSAAEKNAAVQALMTAHVAAPPPPVDHGTFADRNGGRATPTHLPPPLNAIAADDAAREAMSFLDCELTPLDSAFDTDEAFGWTLVNEFEVVQFAHGVRTRTCSVCDVPRFVVFGNNRRSPFSFLHFFSLDVKYQQGDGSMYGLWCTAGSAATDVGDGDDAEKWPGCGDAALQNGAAGGRGETRVVLVTSDGEMAVLARSPAHFVKLLVTAAGAFLDVTSRLAADYRDDDDDSDDKDDDGVGMREKMGTLLLKQRDDECDDAVDARAAAAVIARVACIADTAAATDNGDAAVVTRLLDARKALPLFRPKNDDDDE
jgi:hypothetical protein